MAVSDFVEIPVLGRISGSKDTVVVRTKKRNPFKWKQLTCCSTGLIPSIKPAARNANFAT